MEEQWKPVVGYEGWYEVSDLGRIKAVAREVIRSNKGNGVCKHIKNERILLGSTGGQGYKQVSLCVVRKPGQGKVTVRAVHILVMEAFIGPRPEGAHIDHLNRNKMDARLCNLEYVTHRENCGRGLKGVLHPKRTCSLNGVSKIEKTGKYVAQKSWCKKKFSLGRYDTMEEAHEVYLLATHEDAIEIKKLQPRWCHSKISILAFLRERHGLHLTTSAPEI